MLLKLPSLSPIEKGKMIHTVLNKWTKFPKIWTGGRVKKKMGNAKKNLFFHKGRCQKRFSGFFPLRGGGYPPFPLRVFGQDDFPLRGVGGTPQFR